MYDYNVVCSIISLYLNTYYSKKLIDYSFFNQIKDLIPVLLVSLLMGFTVYASIYFISSNMLKMITALFLGPLSYYILSFLFKFEEVKEINKLLVKLKSKI